MDGGSSEYGASLSFATGSGASNSGAAQGGGGGGTKYQIVSGSSPLAALAGLTPKQLWPVAIGSALLVGLIIILIFRRK